MLSICDSLEVSLFIAVSVGELQVGSKSIKAWLSSKDCIRLRTSEKEPIKKDKIIIFRSESKI